MRLIDADALRERWNVSEKCEDCKQDARYYNGDLYGSELYSLRDICESIDDAPIITAIPVEWLMDLANRGDFVYNAVARWKQKQEAQE